MDNALIVEDFLELVELEVQSRNERKMADILKMKLTALGLTVDEDEAAAKVGGNTGNLTARLPGDSQLPAVLLSAHMDRVGNTGKIRPIVRPEEDRITSDGRSILAADDVAGICAILDGLRRIKAAGFAHGDVEVAFSVCEEQGVLGARYLDFSRFKAKMAFVFDAPGRIGRIVNQAPTKCRIKAAVHGRSAHAGNEPEKGLNAIRVAAAAIDQLPEGRISPRTTANFGSIHGGSSTNVVCDLVEIAGEARSTDSGELAQYIEQVKAVFAATAARYQTTIDLNMETLYDTFFVPETAAAAVIARRAMQNLGVDAWFSSGGGGMDGNHFNKNGILAVGLAIGYSKNHTLDEQIIISDLVKGGELAAEIVRTAALQSA